MTNTIDRRKFMTVGGVAAVTAVATGVGGEHLLGKRSPAPRPAMSLAAPPGTPTPTPTLKVTPKPQPLQPSLDITGLSPFYTPESQFYRVDTALVVPQVTAASWQLRIHGMVDRPMTISLNELMQQPMVEHDITLTCVSEAVGGGYIGNARWQGTLLADVLRKAGIQAGAEQIVMRDVLTVATTRTRLTSVRKTVGCCARSVAAQDKAASQRQAHRRLAGGRDMIIPLSFHPDLAVHEVLLLPDGDYLLEAVDTFQRGLERGPPVWRRNDHRHAGLTDQQSSQALHHGDPLQVVGGGDFAADPGHGLERHGFVTFVIQALRGPALGMVAHRALERHHGALGAGEQTRDHGPGVDGAADQGEVVPGFRDFQYAGIAPATHGRQKGHFVAFGQFGRGIRNLLIPRHYDAARQAAEGRKTRRVTGEHRAQVGTLGEFGLFPGRPHNIPQHPKKQYANTHDKSITLSLSDATRWPSGCAGLQSFFAMNPVTECRLRVRYAETDQMGVVYYANYLIWMEVGRVELCKACGFNYRDMEMEDGVFLAVAESHCQYRFPARFDDEVVVKTW